MGENIVSVSGELTECLGHQAESIWTSFGAQSWELVRHAHFKGLLLRPSEGETPWGLGRESRFYQRPSWGMLTPPQWRPLM